MLRPLQVLDLACGEGRPSSGRRQTNHSQMEGGFPMIRKISRTRLQPLSRRQRLPPEKDQFRQVRLNFPCDTVPACKRHLRSPHQGREVRSNPLTRASCHSVWHSQLPRNTASRSNTDKHPSVRHQLRMAETLYRSRTMLPIVPEKPGPPTNWFVKGITANESRLKTTSRMRLPPHRALLHGEQYFAEYTVADA